MRLQSFFKRLDRVFKKQESQLAVDHNGQEIINSHELSITG